jgi:hypothetical protein
MFSSAFEVWLTHLKYYKLFDSATNVYSLISVQDSECNFCGQSSPLVRQALTTSPQNVTSLLLSLSHHLFTLLPSPLFPTAASRTLQGQDTTREALNCLRVLGRVLVVIYEADSDERENAAAFGTTNTGKRYAEEVLWSRKPVVKDEEVVEPQAPENQFTIEDSDSEDEDGVAAETKAFKSDSNAASNDDPLAASASQPKTEEEEKTLPSLADRLFSCTVDLLFCAGFTVPEGVRGTEGLGDKINVSP